MKRQYVRELAEGMRVDAYFALVSKEMRSTRAGEAYLAMELGDRTGRMPAVYFKPSSESVSVPSGAVVTVRGTVSRFRGSKRVSVEYLAPVSDYDAGDLLESSQRDREEVVEEFKKMAATVRDAQLRRVIRAVFGDTGFFGRFADCPGARTHHHAYLGGLIEHTLAVARLCRSLGTVYPGVDVDLLTTAALLHDIGKVDELTWDTAVGYTDEGRLLGHVVLSDQRMRNAVASLSPALPAGLVTRISHSILSHHGELEWGSPKRPSTIEALLLHHADNLDAKADGFLALTAAASHADEQWTDAVNLFRRPLYAPAPLADGRPVPDMEAAHLLVRA